MAYHFTFNPHTYTLKTITTATVDRHKLEGWRVFDTEAERDAALPHRPWYVNYQGRDMIQISESDAAFHRTIANVAIFQTKEEALAALAAHPLTYGIDAFTGQVHLRRTWLEPSKRTNEGAGIYTSEREARLALEQFRLMAVSIQSGETRFFFPHNAAAYTRDRGWLTGKTLEECRAQLPVRYMWDYSGANYHRVYTGAVMVRPSAFAQLRAALRGENRVGTFSFDPVLVINQACRFSHDIQEYRYERQLRETLYTMERAISRAQAMAPDLDLHLCADCAYRACGDEYQNTSGENICYNCSEDYHECAECDTRDNSRNMHSDDGAWYCTDHRPARGVNGELQHYSDNVLDTREGFLLGKGQLKADLFLGFELEVYAREQEMGRTHTIRHVQQTSQGWGICKSDGSIGEGFELVSIPATLAWHQENVRPWLAANNQYIEGWSHNDCGMHVHVGKEQLSELTQGKLLVFMHEYENQDFLTHLAGRSMGNYCQRGSRKKAMPSYRVESGLGRYQALNFATRDGATIEFRIFRSNVAVHGFMRNLEFVHALCSWARGASMLEVASQYHIKGERGHRGHKAFIDYVATQRSLYPSLVRWLENAQYLEPRIRTLDQVPERHRAQASQAFLSDNAA